MQKNDAIDLTLLVISRCDKKTDIQPRRCQHDGKPGQPGPDPPSPAQ